MKKFSLKHRIIISVFAVVLLTVTITAGADNSDPLVTLSYINETVIPKIKEDVKVEVLAIIDERAADKPETPAEPETPSEPEIPAEPEAPAVTQEDISPLKYSVVYLVKGQKLFATGDNTESTEVILRAGEVRCISPFGDQGIADLTASKELYNEDALTKNNYCLIPRGGDGRGIYAVSSDAYILVRGEYEIVQE